jgi:hypothetical protein
MMPHPFMPDLSGKSLDDIVKEMNDIYAKMRGVRNNDLLMQMNMVMEGYRAEYTIRMQQEQEKSSNKSKKSKGAAKDE